MAARKTNLDLVDACDKFPYAEKNPEAHAELLKSTYTLVWDDGRTSTPIGYITESVFNQLAKVPIKVKGELEVNRAKRTISAFNLPTEEERSKAVAATCDYWRQNKTFKILLGWRDELYPIYGPNNEILFNLERSASPLFGILSFGMHMTAFVRCSDASHGMKIWVPRRSKTKSTYPSMLDNTVAGGLPTGEDPFEGMVRESEEEASLPDDFVRKNAVFSGTVTYIYIRGSNAGGEKGFIQPELQYIYDLQLPADIVPKPNDSEVEGFYLWTVEEVQERMANGEFKENCALVLLDFFIRHGILTPENESNFEEIRRRIHRKLDFPLGPHSY